MFYVYHSSHLAFHFKFLWLIILLKFQSTKIIFCDYYFVIIKFCTAQKTCWGLQTYQTKCTVCWWLSHSEVRRYWGRHDFLYFIVMWNEFFCNLLKFISIKRIHAVAPNSYNLMLSMFGQATGYRGHGHRFCINSCLFICAWVTSLVIIWFLTISKTPPPCVGLFKMMVLYPSSSKVFVLFKNGLFMQSISILFSCTRVLISRVIFYLLR